jgi:hypothetical protein
MSGEVLAGQSFALCARLRLPPRASKISSELVSFCIGVPRRTSALASGSRALCCNDLLLSSEKILRKEIQNRNRRGGLRVRSFG